MKKLLSLLPLLGFVAISYAQVSDMGNPVGWKDKMPQKNIPIIEMPGFDQELAHFEDSINEANKIGPWRFGYEYITNYALNDNGIWTDLPNGDRVWRTIINCPGAQTINLQFSNFNIPEGAYLYLYDVDRTNVVGAYTSENHNPDGLLGTELVHGDEIIVEYYEPAVVINQGDFNISMVVHGYRSVKEYVGTLGLKALNSSGDCNIDVYCPLGNPWGDQIRSVGMLVNGGGFCSGALINNNCDDGTGYFLTADHCGTASGSWNIRWNWDTPLADVSCATTAPSTDPGPPYDQTSNGCTPVVQNGGSDFNLITINNFTETDAQNWNLFYAGWDNTDANTVTTAIGIHHPQGDVKKICEEVNGLNQTTWGGADCWHVPDWDQGVTEPGSSGSPLFDQNGRIIGQLYGGTAACSGTNDNNAPDYYGRFGISWGLGASTYLGACGAATTNDGYDPNGVTISDDAGIQGVNYPTGQICAANFDPEVVLRNYGTSPLTSVTINYDIDNGPNQVYNWTGNLASGATVNVALPNMTTSAGPHTFNAATELPNGTADLNTSNDAASNSFTLAPNGQDVQLVLDTDCYGSEVTWEIQDGSSNVLFSGGPYNDVTGGETIVVDFCLDPGCYDFIIDDSWGDGLYGSQWPGCTVDGDYTITQVGTAQTLATLQAANADYGNQEVNNFCVTSPCNGTLSATSVDPLCFGDSNGSVTVTVTGGDAPFTYDIGSGAQGSGTFTNLAGGTYTVTVIDNNSCSNTIDVTLTEPSELTGTISFLDETCSGSNDGSIDMTATGGTGPYQYSVDNGSTYQGGTSFTGLIPGSYNPIVQDANGCQFIPAPPTVSISTGTGVTANLNISDISCNGLTDGQIQVVTTNGTAPFTYDIGSGAQGSDTFTGLSQGAYTITIEDDNGCTGTVNGTVNEPAAMSHTYTTTDEIFGNDGSIDLTMSGGTAPFNYSWSGPNSFSSSSEDPSGLEAGSYTCTVTDANGCTYNVTGIEVDSQLSLGEVNINFNVFPNPSNGVFNVQLLNTDQDVTVSIVDLTGRLVYSQQITGKSIFSIDISDKAEGTYFIRISDGEIQTAQPIINHQ